MHYLRVFSMIVAMLPAATGATKWPPTPPAVPAKSAAAVAGGVRAVYRKGGNLTATFTQTYHDALRHKDRRQSGHMWVHQDGRVHWRYEVPERKDFVFDGKHAYFYEPENAQVTVFENFVDAPLFSALQFLWGAGDLRHAFKIELCGADCPTAGAGETRLLLHPLQPVAAVAKVVLFVTETMQVVRTQVFDPLGNVTEYTFSDLSWGKAVRDDHFHFEVPDGVAVINTGNPRR